MHLDLQHGFLGRDRLHLHEERMTTDAELEQKYPWIEWREPLPITRTDGAKCFGCRLCIAKYGLKAQAIPQQPQTLEEFEYHMETAHAR
jgi:hypothetical protein